MSPCVWSVGKQMCIDSAFLELRCLSGLCGSVVHSSPVNCPLSSCSKATYCHDCFKMSSCGWLSVENENGLGNCLEGSAKVKSTFRRLVAMD